MNKQTLIGDAEKNHIKRKFIKTGSIKTDFYSTNISSIMYFAQFLDNVKCV